VQALHARARLRTVSGDSSVFASAYWLEIEVMDFQAEYASGVTAPTIHCACWRASAIRVTGESWVGSKQLRAKLRRRIA